jgi:hypothetical protein
MSGIFCYDTSRRAPVCAAHFTALTTPIAAGSPVYKKSNGSRLPGDFFDEAVALQGLDHIVNRGRGNLEVVLQVRLRGSLAVDLGVVVNEGQILTLFCGE